MFYGHFGAGGRLNGPSETSEGNEAKSTMKQPSDVPTPRFEHAWQ